jgi:hypothetical protein
VLAGAVWKDFHMKKIILCLSFLLSMPAFAGDLQNVCNVIALGRTWECESIKDPDWKNFCDANIDLLGMEEYLCSQIVNPDIAHFCQATAMVRENECDGIVAGDLKKVCIAIAQLKPESCDTVKDGDMKNLCAATSQQQYESCEKIEN